jgi:hypothetical protein
MPRPPPRLVVLLVVAGLLAVAAAYRLFFWPSGPSDRDVASSDPARRAQAVDELGRQQTAGAAQRLALLVRDPDPTVAARAVLALAQHARPEDRPVFRAGLSDARPEVREAAAVAVGRCGADDQVQVLVTALTTDRDPRVRGAAALALPQLLVTEPAMTALVSAMRDPDPLVRARAAGAVKQVLGLDFVFDAAGPAEEREKMIRQVESFWPTRYHKYVQYQQRQRGEGARR